MTSKHTVRVHRISTNSPMVVSVTAVRVLAKIFVHQ